MSCCVNAILLVAFRYCYIILQLSRVPLFMERHLCMISVAMFNLIVVLLYFTYCMLFVLHAFLVAIIYCLALRI